MKHLKLPIILLLLSLTGIMTYAQQGEGQVCVRAFEDRNGNSTFDANEPVITQGIGVNLMNAMGVTVDSKLLSDSPTAAQGIVCFQQLGIGDYTVVVTSADYSAVTRTTFNALVVTGSVPVRFDFGGQLITTELESSTNTNSALSGDTQQSVIQGALFGAIGAIVVMGIMIITGMFIYFGVFRRRLNRILATQGTGAFRPVTDPIPTYQPGTGPMPAYQSDTGAFRPVTGEMPAYRQTPTTGSMPAVQPDNPLLTRNPNEGSPPLFDNEDTDQMGTVKG
jgi:hypothetical protein